MDQIGETLKEGISIIPTKTKIKALNASFIFILKDININVINNREVLH